MGNVVLKNIIARDDRFFRVEKGEVFRNYHKFTIASGGDGEILIKTGTEYPFIFLDAEADGDCNVSIYFGTTVSEDGTVMNSGNYNFNSSHTPTTELYHTPTITSDGTYVANTDILGGSGVGTPAAARASASMRGLDVILTQTTNYLIRFTNNAGREIQVKFEMSWIECDESGC